MEGNPTGGSSNSNRGVIRGSTKTKSRYPVEDGGDPIECSGKYCKSCTAALIADCVAICCCPCALLNLLALAFVKVPWKVGRRCLGMEKKKGRRLETKRKCRKNEGDRYDFVVERGGNLEKNVRVEEETLEVFRPGFGGEEVNDKFCAGFEAEKVWFELYQVGHLGFGRLSFTGIQYQGKGN